MNKYTNRFTIGLTDQDSQVYVKVRQGDTKAALLVSLTESGTPYELTSDASAVLAARKPTGTYLYESCEITENRIAVTLPSTFTATAGELRACFRITGSGEAAITTPEFTILVQAPAAPAQT